MNPTNSHAESVNSSNGTPACTSPDEVRAFLDHIKCKDPDEVLGSEATHGLTTAMIQSAVITFVIMAAWTLGAPIWNKAFSETKPTLAKPVDKETKAEPTEPSKTPAPAKEKTASTPAPAKGKTPPGKEFLEKIGATETKPANPKVNPLEKTTDDLFKDIDKK